MKSNNAKSADVIFVYPKHRSYVICHDNRFYQFARMTFSVGAWERRVRYKGSLDDIFVAKESCESGEIDEQVADEIGLNMVRLPDQLHGITANKFLSWWTVNRYGFLHAQDKQETPKNTEQESEQVVLSIQDEPPPPVQTPPPPPIKTVVKEQLIQKLTTPEPPKPMPVAEVAVQAVPQLTPIQDEVIKKTVEPKPRPPSKYATKPRHPPIEELSGNDIFEALFNDLVYELELLRD